jgi:hypothetical protein
MKRSTNVKAALPWLVACAWSAGWAHADPMRPLNPPPAASAAVPAAAVALAAGPDRQARSRDPDAPRETDRLVAIRQDSASRWLALFGERWLGVGDRLDSYTVASIEANTVELAEGRQRRTLHLLPPLWRPERPERSGPTGQPGSGPDPGLSSRPPGRAAARPGVAKSPGPPTALAQAGPAVPSLQPPNGLSTP